MKFTSRLSSGLPASAIGLGCGRLGSVMAGQSPPGNPAPLPRAPRLGGNVFDTANIYGQGRSERFLGEALRGARDVCIITKAGQVFPLAQRVLAPLRGPISTLIKRSSSAQGTLRAVRGQGLPRNYRPEHLR